MTARGGSLRAVAVAAVTPLLEKNPAKALAARAVGVPMAFSMARVIVLGCAVAMLHQIWCAGVAGWPDATLSMAVVLAMPVLTAMERVSPQLVMELARGLVGRFGVGAGRSMASVYSGEPSKFDDHRVDNA
ncbi:MAG TPA: hypothetical protein VMH39_06000 [Gemmatimonadaceae bacterium]|nr:hypothetical protein [Gemmatimonadaceae bacterium]